MSDVFDLMVPENSYIFGLFQTDGSLQKQSRNRGRLALEIKSSDFKIIKQIKEILPVKSFISHRCRDTNFSKNYKSITLTIYDLKFRTRINSLGLPYGPKSKIISPPITKFSEPDYIRGLIDGDGSLGLTKENRPFISLTTQSSAITKYYLSVIESLTKRIYSPKRNKRDNIYNISCFMESAQIISSYLYYDNCLSLARKYNSASMVKTWQRPSNIKRRPPSKRWTLEQDNFILNNSIEDAVKQLNRSKTSIDLRLRRLNGATY